MAVLTLRRPSTRLFPSYWEFMEEMRALGETIWPSRLPATGEPVDAFVDRLLSLEHEAERPMVPQTIYWGVLGDAVVSLIVLRHELDARLTQFGGHISYEVRPSYRRQGLATATLRLVLASERARTMGQLLITCDPDNVGSRKTIEANGGVLERVVFVDEVTRRTCHYRVDV